jgi:hypothetical protein
MPELLQHIIVTVVAFGAAAVIVRRVTGIVRAPRRQATSCANCPSASQHQATDSAAASSSAKPLTLVRR